MRMTTWMRRTCVSTIGAMVLWLTLPVDASAAIGLGAKKDSGATPAVTYSVRTGTAGEMVLAADAGVLQIEKSVFEDGRTTLVLKSDRDEVTIAFDKSGASALSGDTQITINGAQPDESAFGRTRALLSRSKAARLFRDLVAALDRRGQRPNAYEQLLLLGFSELARAEGDTNAVESFARRVGAKKAPPSAGGVGLQPASCSAPIKRVQFTDCVTYYETALMGAFYAWQGCYNNVFQNVEWYWQYQSLWVCDFEYYGRAETYAFQLLRCMAIP